MKKVFAVMLILSLVLSLTACAVEMPSIGDMFGDLGGLGGMTNGNNAMPAPSDSLQQEPQPQETQASETEATTLSQSNPYYSCWTTYVDFVLPNSAGVYYSRADVRSLSQEAREIAKQEIYARHGRSFSDANLQEYFNFRRWYSPGYETALNTIEQANIFLLENYEKELSGGLNSNRYISYMPNPGSYIMPESDRRYLTANDLKNLDHDEIVVIRNEIYARKGYQFDSDNLRSYFYATDWYKPGSNFSTDMLNKYEVGNVEICKLYERKLEGVSFSSKNVYKVCYSGPNTMMIPYSSEQYLSREFLETFTDEELVIARNEISARHGYAFTNKDMQEFFLQCDWYYPSTPPGESDLVKFNDIEEYNRALIREIEAERGKK